MNFLKNVRVAIRLPLVVAVALVALLGFALVAMSTLNAVKIGGPEEAKVSQQNALLADILPPPGYLVETELAAMQMRAAVATGDDAAVTAAIATVQELTGQFRDRMTFWLDTLGGTVQQSSIQQIDDTGEAYLAVVAGQPVPAVQSGDTQAISAAGASTDELFVAHRAAVQAATEVISTVTSEQIAHANSITSGRSRLLWMLLIATLIVVGAAAIAVTLSVVRPLGELRTNMEEIASGDGAENHARLDADRRDEFGQLATAFNEFADKLATYSAEVTSNAHLAEDRALQVSQAATVAASHMNTVAGATAQLSAAASEIARSAGEASRTAQTAVAAETGTATAGWHRCGPRCPGPSPHWRRRQLVGMAGGLHRQATHAALDAALNATIEASSRRRGRSWVRGWRRPPHRCAAISSSQGMIAAAVEEHAATTAEIDRSLAEAVAAVNQLADPTMPQLAGRHAGGNRDLVGAVPGFD